jgi:hypothetical protein
VTTSNCLREIFRMRDLHGLSFLSLDVLEPSLSERRPNGPPDSHTPDTQLTSLNGSPSKSLRSQSSLPGNVSSSLESRKRGRAQSRPLWKTPEFIFYGMAFLVVVPQMILCAWKLSIRTFLNCLFWLANISSGTPKLFKVR